jgi:peptidoglycan/LPS O-acetylase OafA/YrhL
MAAQFLRGIAAFSLVVAVMGYGRRMLNHDSALLGRARDLSFPLYVLHFAPVCLATYFLLSTGLSLWLRWAVTIAASWISVSIFTELARFAPPLRDFFGIRARGKLKAGVVPVSGASLPSRRSGTR